MQRFTTFVNEAFSAPYPVEWGRSTIQYGNKAALFTTDNGQDVEVIFTSVSGGGVRVDFAVGGHEDITGKGEAFRIFSTVMDATKKYVQKTNPNFVVLATINAPESRKKLYRRMALRNKKDYHVYDAAPGGSHHFVIMVPRKYDKQTAYDIVVGAAGMKVKELTA